MPPGPAFICAASERSPGTLKINRSISPPSRLQLHRGSLFPPSQGCSGVSSEHRHAEPAAMTLPCVPFGSIVTDIPGCLGKSFPDAAPEEAGRQRWFVGLGFRHLSGLIAAPAYFIKSLKDASLRVPEISTFHVAGAALHLETAPMLSQVQSSLASDMPRVIRDN